MGRVMLGALALLAGTVLGCRERVRAAQSETAVRDLVRQLRTQAERVTGLQFKRDVAVLLRSRAQVREYVVHKFDEDLPPADLAGAEAAYKLFGLVPDSLDLRRTMIDLLTEQVAGYYDPDSTALFIPRRLARAAARAAGPIPVTRLDHHPTPTERPPLRRPGGPRGAGDLLPDRDPDAGAAARDPAGALVLAAARRDGPAAGRDARIRRRAAVAA
jgi:hypothetical protein